MRWSQAFIPTLREDPAEAEFASHALLLRAGYVRQLAAGIYTFLPLGQRTLAKIAAIIRQEMEAIGAQEFQLPALHPAELWRETGRWETMGDNMFRLQDRLGRDLALGMTHEEVFTDLARRDLSSYKDLPQIWYQIQTKFRDEPRPKSGLLRVREFPMKDSYSFDLSWEGLDASYRAHHDAYCRIYERCGLDYVVVEASSGAMGGSESHEFMVRMAAGEDQVAACAACGYAANLERAVSRLPALADAPVAGGPREVATPGQRTIAEVSAFLGVSATQQIKSLVYMAAGTPLLFLVRGDHQLNETKALVASAQAEARPATAEEIRAAFGAEAGSLGPVGVSGLAIYADEALRGRRGLVCGANRDGYHLLDVTPDEDFAPAWAELRTVAAGEGCPRCGAPLEVYKAVEVGHIFKLGTKYAEAMGARVLTAEGSLVPLIMGSYGIGLGRILAAAVERHHDADGIILPPAIAPYQVILTPVAYRGQPREVADRLYTELLAAGVDVLLDDRDERPGVKFKDADLIGIPLRVVIGERGLARGEVEVVRRGMARADGGAGAAGMGGVGGVGGVEVVAVEEVVGVVRGAI